MTDKILTPDEWNQILEKLLSLFVTIEIPYKEESIRKIVAYFAVIGEKYKGSTLLDNFDANISLLDTSSKILVYRKIAERLHKTSSLKNESLKYFSLYLDLVDEKQIIASKYKNRHIINYIFSLESVLVVTDENIFVFALSIYKNIISQLTYPNKDKFIPSLENFALINGSGHVAYLIKLFRKLGEREVSNKAINKLETYYSILKGRLSEEKNSKLPVISSGILLTDQEVANLDQVCFL